MNSLHSGLLCSNQSLRAPPTKPHPIIPTLIILFNIYLLLNTILFVALLIATKEVVVNSFAAVCILVCKEKISNKSSF